jgi:hypothetical protein
MPRAALAAKARPRQKCVFRLRVADLDRWLAASEAAPAAAE